MGEKDLLPCPLCGGEVEFAEGDYDAWEEGYAVRCRNCSLTFGATGRLGESYKWSCSYRTEAEAAKAWNTRRLGAGAGWFPCADCAHDKGEVKVLGFGTGIYRCSLTGLDFEREEPRRCVNYAPGGSGPGAERMADDDRRRIAELESPVVCDEAQAEHEQAVAATLGPVTCEMVPTFIEPCAIDGKFQEWQCSECGEFTLIEILGEDERPNFCQHCGARNGKAADA